jgi:hypothetical protein
MRKPEKGWEREGEKNRREKIRREKHQDRSEMYRYTA